MLQEVFRLHLFGRDVPIFGYGLMLVVAFLASVQLAKVLAKRAGIDPEAFVNAGLIALVFGVLGARLSHVLENFHDYARPELSLWQNFRNAINIREGGLTYYGGFLLATPACIIYGRLKRIPLRLGMDVVAPCLMVGLAFGRIGCFLNGCCYGAQTNASWGVRFPYHSNAYVEQFRSHEITAPPELVRDTPNGTELLSPDQIRNDPQLKAIAAAQKALPVQPTELYTAFGCFLLAGVLAAYFSLPHLDGRVFALMMVLEGAARFLEEMIRVEPPVYDRWIGSFHVSLSLSMIIGMLLVLGGAVFWVASGIVRPVERFPEEFSGTPALA